MPGEHYSLAAKDYLPKESSFQDKWPCQWPFPPVTERVILLDYSLVGNVIQVNRGMYFKEDRTDTPENMIGGGVWQWFCMVKVGSGQLIMEILKLQVECSQYKPGPHHGLVNAILFFKMILSFPAINGTK